MIEHKRNEQPATITTDKKGYPEWIKRDSEFLNSSALSTVPTVPSPFCFIAGENPN